METQMTNYKTCPEQNANNKLQDMSGWKRIRQITRQSWSGNTEEYRRVETRPIIAALHTAPQPPRGVNSGDRQENHIRTAANTISQICKFGCFRAKFFQVDHLFDISCSMFQPASPNMFHHLTQLDFREYLLKKADISFTGLHQEF